jgi:hypothetical protein
MKSFIVLGLVGFCTVLFTCNSAMATEKEGGGKNSNKHDLHIKNMEHDKPVCCWLRPQGTHEPRSRQEWEAVLVCIDAYPGQHSSKMKEGYHECTIVTKDHYGNYEQGPTKVINCNQERNYCCDDEHMWEEGGYHPPHGGGGNYGGGNYGGGNYGGGNWGGGWGDDDDDDDDDHGGWPY